MHVTIIAKLPAPGRVKTRLCPPCTHVQAAALAMALLRDTIDAVDALVDAQPVRKVLLLDGGRPGWAPDDYDVERQSDGGLGERLANGFAALGPGVIVGMETPHAVSTLQPAVDAVARGCDALAPASDGGYWAIG